MADELVSELKNVAVQGHHSLSLCPFKVDPTGLEVVHEQLAGSLCHIIKVGILWSLHEVVEGTVEPSVCVQLLYVVIDDQTGALSGFHHCGVRVHQTNALRQVGYLAEGV